MGPVQLHPSELVKLVVVLVLAAYLSRNAAGNPRVFVGSLGLVALPALLIAVQPDLGTALVSGAIFVMIMFTGGARLWQMVGLGALGAGGAYQAVKLGILHAYQVARLTSFLDPQASTNDLGYQGLQSQSAIGSGGSLGKGLDAATLANLGFFPRSRPISSSQTSPRSSGSSRVSCCWGCSSC